MDIEFNCNKCGQHIVIDATGAGETVQCPACHRWLRVPAPDVVKEQPSPVERAQPPQTRKSENIGTMSIRFQCPECKGRLSCAKERAEKQVNCPHCEKTITVPACATVFRRFIQTDGLETTLRTLGGIMLALSIVAAIAAIVSGVAMENAENKVAWLSLAIGTVFAGVIQFYFFCWAGELLAAVKKMAGLAYEPHFKTYDKKTGFFCMSCEHEVTSEDKTCPNCKRVFLWQEKESNATEQASQ